MSDEPFNLIADTGRRCGECSLCCKVMPAVGVTPWNERCQHQRFTGCRLYPNHPIACRAFTCMWLAGADTEGLKRPDRGRYIVSTLPDYIEIKATADSPLETIPVLEIWLDPKFPDAHRDPGLRAYLERMAERGMLAVVRRSPEDSFVIFAPKTNSTGEWQEQRSTQGPQRTTRDRIEKLGLKIEAEEGALEKLYAY